MEEGEEGLQGWTIRKGGIIMSNDENETERTVVVIRRWACEPYSLIALFPEIASDDLGHIESFEWIGGHGGASLRVINRTRPVSYDDEDVQYFVKQLRTIGYNPILRKKITRKMLDKGREALKRFDKKLEDFQHDH